MIKGQFKHENKTIKWKFYIKRKFNSYLPITKYKIKRKFGRKYIYYAEWEDKDACLDYFYGRYLKGKLLTMVEGRIIRELQDKEKRKILKKLFNI